MSDADDIAAWLLERIAEDEQAALRALAGSPTLREGEPALWWQRYHKVEQHDEVTPEGDILRKTHVADCGPANVFPARHIVNWQPKRVLAECDAKRITIALCTGPSEQQGIAARAVARSVLQLLALPYSDRPGYREEWRP